MQQEIIGVLGSGSWGTALVHALLINGHTVHWWVRRAEARAHIAEKGRNPYYLSDLALPTANLYVHDAAWAVTQHTQTLLLATPSAFLTVALQQIDASGLRLASATKGLVPGTPHTVTQWLHVERGVPLPQLAVVSGPSHSEEVAQGMHTWLVSASASADHAQLWQRALMRHTLHVATDTDVAGIEWSGVLKNVYALVVGVGLGLGHGNNMLAALVGASMQEMETLLGQLAPLQGRAMGSPPLLGDLLTTCYSPHSRNRTLGYLLGQGRSTEQALAEMSMVAEGFYSSRTLVEICQVHAPLIHLAYAVVHQGVPAAQAFDQVMRLI